MRDILRIMLAASGIVLAGCATMEKGKPVATDDQVEVRFTCRLKNGDIVISTAREIAGKASVAKSAIFIPRNDDSPLTISAGRKSRGEASDDVMSFEDRVIESVAVSVVGMTPGEWQTIQLKGERKEKNSRGEDNTITMARVTHRAKEMTIAKEDLLARTGKTPVEGDEIDLGEGVRARAVSIDDDTVSLRFLVTEDMRIQTPFGPGKVHETPTDLEIVIDAQVGQLVRTGPLVGRITAADDATFTLDYGHPFGGEELSCDVAVEPATKIAKQGD